MSFNLKSGIRWVVLAGAIVTSSGCTVWNVPEFNRVPFNARHGDRVDVTMDPNIVNGVHPWDRCMDYGGALMRHETAQLATGAPPVPGATADDNIDNIDNIVTALVTVIICEGVDF